MQSTSFELKNKVVRAGAGAGKTTNLTTSVLQIASDFYKANDRLPNMVVTTFTRKATEELRERITSELFKSDEPALFGLVQSKQHLQISTIHGGRCCVFHNLDLGFIVKLKRSAVLRLPRF